MWSVLKIKQTFMSLRLMQDGSVPLSLPLLKCDMLEFDAKVSISLKSQKYLFQSTFDIFWFRSIQEENDLLLWLKGHNWTYHFVSIVWIYLAFEYLLRDGKTLNISKGHCMNFCRSSDFPLQKDVPSSVVCLPDWLSKINW